MGRRTSISGFRFAGKKVASNYVIYRKRTLPNPRECEVSISLEGAAVMCYLFQEILNEGGGFESGSEISVVMNGQEIYWQMFKLEYMCLSFKFIASDSWTISSKEFFNYK